MALRLLTAALIATAVASYPAFACKGDEEIFSDDFSTVDAAWKSPNESYDNFSIFAGKLRLRPQAGQSWLVLYHGGGMRDADICVDVTAPEGRQPRTLNGGLAFWYQRSGFYVFDVTPDGRAAINRLDGGKWSSPVPFRKAEGFKTGADSSNTLRLTLKGAKGTAHVNDRPFASFEGESPQAGGLVGFYGRSEPHVPKIWTFANFRITK